MELHHQPETKLKIVAVIPADVLSALARDGAIQRAAAAIFDDDLARRFGWGMGREVFGGIVGHWPRRNSRTIGTARCGGACLTLAFDWLHGALQLQLLPAQLITLQRLDRLVGNLIRRQRDNAEPQMAARGRDRLDVRAQDQAELVKQLGQLSCRGAGREIDDVNITLEIGWSHNTLLN
jgi:hypothetical protein